MALRTAVNRCLVCVFPEHRYIELFLNSTASGAAEMSESLFRLSDINYYLLCLLVLFFLHHLASQVAVAAVDTTVTLEEAAAHEAVGFEAHTDDVILLFRSILMFSPLLATPPACHIHPKYCLEAES